MKNVFRRSVGSFLFGAVIELSCAPQVEDPSPKQNKFSPELRDALVLNGSKDVIVLFHDSPDASHDISIRSMRYQQTADILRSKINIEELHAYSHLPMMSLTLDDIAMLEALGESPLVAQIFEDLPHEATLTQSLDLIQQPDVAASGKTGAGTTVAVLDTGADFTHAAFGGCTSAGAPGCKVIVAQDFAPNDNLRDDDSKHGTNVSGIVLGVAPDAKIAALDVFRSDGFAYSSDIIAALNWAIENKSTYNIAAVNMSLGGGSATAPCTNDAFSAALENVKAAGIVPVVASGNNGFINALSSPACAPAAVSVGAVYSTNFGGISWSSCSDATTGADRVTCFSNSAPFLSILAPGALINAAGITMGGTSQAAPHVAGAMAVLKANYPDQNPDELLARLQNTGVAVTDPRNGVLKKRIDLNAATSDCIQSISPTSLSFSSDGGSNTISIFADDSCPWSATLNAPFFSVSPASGVGDGSVIVTVPENNSDTRTGTFSIAGRTVSVTQESGLDGEGPVGSVVINQGDSFTGSTSVSLAFDATDPSGVDGVCVSSTSNCSSFTPFTLTKTFSLSAGTGARTVYARFRDTSGNISELVSDSIILDQTKPIDGTIITTPGSSQIALSWDGFSDANSGVASYKLVFAATAAPPSSCSSGAALSIGSSNSFTHTGLVNGTTYAYRVCAIDRVGNVSAGVAVTARPATEFTPPVGTVIINSGATFTRAESVTLALSASDTSGVSGMCISSTATCSSFIAFSSSKAFVLPAGSGVKTVNVWFKDAQGNISTTPASDTITLDATRPFDGALTAITAFNHIRLSWSAATDSGSGVASYKLVFTKGNAAPVNCNAGTPLYAGSNLSFLHLGLSAATKYNYRVCAIDNAGNVSYGRVFSFTTP